MVFFKWVFRVGFFLANPDFNDMYQARCPVKQILCLKTRYIRNVYLNPDLVGPIFNYVPGFLKLMPIQFHGKKNKLIFKNGSLSIYTKEQAEGGYHRTYYCKRQIFNIQAKKDLEKLLSLKMLIGIDIRLEPNPQSVTISIPHP